LPELSSQLDLFPPSVTRKLTVRRRRQFRFFDVRGEVRVRFMVESVPCAIPTSADDKGLPDFKRWTPPRHARSFDALAYQDDMSTRMFVRDHPEGASLQEVADAIGWSKQGVMEVERRALRKLIEQARDDEATLVWMADNLGIDADEVAAMLERLP
jgi:hypothetical protein